MPIKKKRKILFSSISHLKLAKCSKKRDKIEKCCAMDMKKEIFYKRNIQVSTIRLFCCKKYKLYEISQWNF